MVFGHRKPEPIPVVVEAPKVVAEELLLLIGLGLFCLLAVLFIGQVARVLGFIGGKLVNAMVSPCFVVWQSGIVGGAQKP